MKGRWCLGMGERKEKKRKRGGCGSDQGLYETRVVCGMGGWIKSEWECRGKERMKLIIKEKKKKYTPGLCDRSPCAHAGILGSGDC